MPYYSDGYAQVGYVEGSGLSVIEKTQELSFVVNKSNVGINSVENFILKLVGTKSKLFVSINRYGIYLHDVKNSNIETIEVSSSAEVDYNVIKNTLENDSIFLSNLKNSIKDDLKQQIVSELLNNTQFKQEIVSSIDIKILTQTGQEIPLNLVWDANTSSYTIDYDTSNLDGTNYTINITV